MHTPAIQFFHKDGAAQLLAGIVVDAVRFGQRRDGTGFARQCLHRLHRHDRKQQKPQKSRHSTQKYPYRRTGAQHSCQHNTNSRRKENSRRRQKCRSEHCQREGKPKPRQFAAHISVEE